MTQTSIISLSWFELSNINETLTYQINMEATSISHTYSLMS